MSEQIEKMAKHKMGEEDKVAIQKERDSLKGISVFDAYFEIAQRIRKGQAAKGFMNLRECEVLVVSMDNIYGGLKNVACKEKNPFARDNLQKREPELIETIHYQSLDFLNRALEKLQSTGFFEIEESVAVLNAIREIETEFNKNRSKELEKTINEAKLKAKNDTFDVPAKKNGEKKKKGHK